jgi:uncharacterized membrane protein YoaK (UPF0700 family)
MFKHRADESAGNLVVLHWFLLSFNGGCINAGGFLATGRFVSHVTGFATLFGVDMANSQIDAALGILSVPIFFLIGAFIAGLFIDRQIHNGSAPHFDLVMSLSSFCLFAAASGGKFLHVGPFGELAALKESYILLVLLCLASGLQNGAITSSSGHSVRTTHLTGLTTDLGLGLARVLTFNLKSARQESEKRANLLRAGSILSFVIGSAVGAWIFVVFGFFGFILPAIIAAYCAIEGRKAKMALRKLPNPE